MKIEDVSAMVKKSLLRLVLSAKGVPTSTTRAGGQRDRARHYVSLEKARNTLDQCDAETHTVWCGGEAP